MESRKIFYYEQITNALVHLFLADISCWFRVSITSSFNRDSYISSEGLRRCQTGGDVSQPKSLSPAIFGPLFAVVTLIIALVSLFHTRFPHQSTDHPVP